MNENEKLILQELIFACYNSTVIGKEQAEDMLDRLQQTSPPPGVYGG